MKQKLNMKVNPLPVRTWNWLGMNETTLEQAVMTEGDIKIDIPETIVQVEDFDNDFDSVSTGMGSDMNKLIYLSNIETQVFQTLKEKKEKKALKLHFYYEDKAQDLNVIGLDLKENSEMIVIMDYTSSKKGQGTIGVQTKIRAEKNAKLCLVQIQCLGDGFCCMNDIGAICQEGAEIQVIDLILGGKSTYVGCKTKLEGDRSILKADIGYLIDHQDCLDMNYVALHEGKNTVSEIHASGVLRDQAFKLFRGTIDFQRGCAGAQGEESEDVLLLDDTIINQTIPLILCAEEDVQGNHGATIGKLDEELLFYLESRGICQKEIYEMMAKARIDTICRKIPDEEAQIQVKNYMEGRSSDE